jgi:hypothetical protein
MVERIRTASAAETALGKGRTWVTLSGMAHMVRTVSVHFT